MMTGRTSLAEQGMMEEDDSSTYDRVVDLINQATLISKDREKIEKLLNVQELIVNKEPALLDNFLDEMLAFQSGHSAEVKKFIIGFMEAACKQDPEVLVKVVPNVNLLLHEDNVNVQKRALLGFPFLLVSALSWIAQSKLATDDMEQIWEALTQMKNMAIELLESDNDGIRTHSVKCMEIIVLALTEKTPDSEIPSKTALTFTIDELPSNHKFLRFKKLSNTGQKTFDNLLHFQASAHISSINLMTAMTSLTNIARQRPQFYPKVLQAFETLNVNLPPTLAKSQVSSVRKNLKMHLFQLLKHKTSVDHISRLSTLLTDLGATQAEVSKLVPKYDDTRKRKSMTAPTDIASKKAKVDESEIEIDELEIGMTPWSSKENRPSAKLRTTAIDITAEDIKDRLTPENVADLVLISMVMLPETQPAQFASIYTPIAEAGTEQQIKHLSRLLATQLTMAGMGKGIADVISSAKTTSIGDETPFDIESTGAISVIGQEKREKGILDIFKTPDLSSRQSGRRMKQFKLSQLKKNISMAESNAMVQAAFERIISTDSSTVSVKENKAREKLLVTLVTRSRSLLKADLLEYIISDLKTNANLALAWIYQEYATCYGYDMATPTTTKTDLSTYDDSLTMLLNKILAVDSKNELFTRLILESPLITVNVLQIVKSFCLTEDNTAAGMVILEQLISHHPNTQHLYLAVMLELTTNEQNEIRSTALECVRKLYMKSDLKTMIDEYALTNLRYLLLPKPPDILFSAYRLKADVWVDEIVKMCLSLYLGLLPVNHSYLHELAKVYTAAIADVKRLILRVIEHSVKDISMNSPELLSFISTCPKGSETLVTRINHVLTEKAQPTPELVNRVKDLYQKRVPDIRFLIPILTGLSKNEVIAAIPKLIKLNPVVVKEVFHRLLNISSRDTPIAHTSPISAVDFLLSLHNIDPAKCDVKTVIKAINLCFMETAVYTQETLAVVLQQLMEQPTVPTLFMRTVLQAMVTHPGLEGFVLNILSRLIGKKVWENKWLFEGFVKCCEKMQPQSHSLLLQLPAQQLAMAFEFAPTLRQTLLNNIDTFTPMQKTHIPKSIMETLQLNYPPGTLPHMDVEESPSDVSMVDSTQSMDISHGKDTTHERLKERKSDNSAKSEVKLENIDTQENLDLSGKQIDASDKVLGKKKRRASGNSRTSQVKSKNKPENIKQHETRSDFKHSQKSSKHGESRKRQTVSPDDLKRKRHVSPKETRANQRESPPKTDKNNSSSKDQNYKKTDYESVSRHRRSEKN